MKIVCDNCATKYSIADDKVRGKVFKIRCKKCSHIIVVRGSEGEAAADGGQISGTGMEAESSGPSKFDQKETKVFDYAGSGYDPSADGAGAAAAAPEGSAPVWHLVIDREQVGPMTADEVAQRFARGEIEGETFAWREGFADWSKLSAIPDFAHLAAQAPASASSPYGGSHSGMTGMEPTERSGVERVLPQAGSDDDDPLFAAGRTNADIASPFASAAPVSHPAGDLFAPGQAAQPRGHASAELFNSSAGSSGSSGGLFGGADAAAQADPRVDAQRLTAQRSENSVLFSLNNLQALAMGSPKGGAAPAPNAKPGHANSGGSEGSGLIDIRAMAANAGGSSAPVHSNTSHLSDDDLPSFGASAFSPVAAPVLLPTASIGMPKWVWGLLGGGSLLLVVMVIMMVAIFTKKEPPPVALPSPATAAPSAPIAAAPTKPSASDEKKSAATEEKKDDKQDKLAADDKGKASKSAARPSGHRRERGGAEPPVEAAPGFKSDQPLAPQKAAKQPKAGGDELDALLNKAIGGPSGSPSPSRRPSGGGGDDFGAPKRAAAPVDENLPDAPSPRQIQGIMTQIKPRVSSCYNQFNVPGIVNISMTIGPTGRVQNANPTGKFAGTPTGECVARAAKGASFPRFKGAAISIEYPFVLSK